MSLPTYSFRQIWRNTSNLQFSLYAYRISDFIQEWRDRNGPTIRESPDELFNKFLQISSILSEIAHQWPIQICSTYYTALTEDKANRMVSNKFVMPPLIELDTKGRQLAALKASVKPPQNSIRH